MTSHLSRSAGHVPGGRHEDDGRRARRAQTREVVLRAAARLFAEKGFDSAGVDEIASAAGVSKGAVFYGFATKEALFVAVMQRVADTVAALLAESRGSLRGREALQAQAWAVMQAADDSPTIGQLMTREIFGSGGPWAEHRRTARELVVAPLVVTLAEIRSERGLPDPGGNEGLAVALLGALVFAALDRRTYTPERSLAQVHGRLMVVLAALGAE